MTAKKSWTESPKLKRVLAELEKHGNVKDACRAAKAGRGWVYRWRQKDSDFADEFDRAKKCGLEVLLDEAHRRAFEGVEEPRTIAGEEVWVRKYSDSLLMFLIKQMDPSYREHFQIDHGNAGGRPFLLQMKLHPDALAAQAAQEGTT